MVEAEASVTPRSTTSRCSSAREKRESGRPCSRGSSQATAFTCATSSGGKTARATRPRSILEPLEPLVVEASSPAGDDLRRRLQPAGDLHVRQPLGRVQDHLRPLHDLVRQRVAGDPALELGPLLAAQDDPIGAPSRHRGNRFAAATSAPSSPTELPAGSTKVYHLGEGDSFALAGSRIICTVSRQTRFQVPGVACYLYQAGQGRLSRPPDSYGGFRGCAGGGCYPGRSRRREDPGGRDVQTAGLGLS
jgi:hypothetical protein